MHRKDFLPLGSSLSFFWWFFKNWKPLFGHIQYVNKIYFSILHMVIKKSVYISFWLKLHCTARWRLFKLQSVYHINDLNIRIEVVPNFSIPPTEAYESLCTHSSSTYLVKAMLELSPMISSPMGTSYHIRRMWNSITTNIHIKNTSLWKIFC